MTTGFPPPARLGELPTWLLSQAALRSQALLSQAMSEAGSRSYHYRLLAALDEAGPSSQADLGRATGMDRSDVVSALNELSELKAITRRPDPHDARRNRVSLTTSGRRRLVRLDRIVGRVQEEVLAPLSVRDRAQLSRLLGRLQP